MDTWLNTASQSWSSDLASLLVPFADELECYPVPKEVGKVGNNSADFVKPVSERKGNIAGFFANQAKKSTSPVKPSASGPSAGKAGKEEDEQAKKGAKAVGKEDDEIMEVNPDEVASKGVKRSKTEEGDSAPSKKPKSEPSPSKKKQASPAKSPDKKEAGQTSLTDFVK